ncbi:MAG: nuclear transport factor 2 family protein [Acidimicrobiia bacterium]|nr:nuclear transport factor 2 family protein [Acidimicrobiia bacterium]
MNEQERADRHEIRKIVDDYALFADRVDNESLAGLFAPDGVLRIFERGNPEPVRQRIGREEIAGAIKGLSRYDVTLHVVSNHYVEIEGDVATGESYCRASHIRPVEGGVPEARENYIMNIRYLDEFIRTIEGWRIAKRELQVEFTEVSPIL